MVYYLIPTHMPYFLRRNANLFGRVNKNLFYKTALQRAKFIQKKCSFQWGLQKAQQVAKKTKYFLNEQKRSFSFV
jgi:hypothetical protein